LTAQKYCSRYFCALIKECVMKILVSILLAFALSSIAFAQKPDRTSPQGSQATQGNQGQANPQAEIGKNKNMSGTVSQDGKTLRDEADNKSYTVDNPDALKGKENQHLAIVVAVYPETKTVHIIKLEAPQQ
jgi:hypothetical protein